MKVAVDKNTKKIIDLMPDSADETSSFIVSNGYILLDVVDPVSEYVEVDGHVSCVFRELVDADFTKWTAKHWKEKRQELVDSIEVEFAGVVYQGDEVSQDRMSRAVVGMATDDSTIQWKAKDNSVHVLSRSELKEVLRMAGQKQTEIWFMN